MLLQQNTSDFFFASPTHHFQAIFLPLLIKNKEYSDWLKGYGLSHIDFDERLKDKNWLYGWILSEDLEGFTKISGVNNHPHNTYLQLLSETGFLGFLFVVAIWIFCIFKLFTDRQAHF